MKKASNLTYSKLLLLAMLLMCMACKAHADSSLLFLETQMVSGYSWKNSKMIFYSQDPQDVMQKPSIGFDYLRKLSSGTGDWGTFAMQARLAYSQDDAAKIQPQLYNAYLKYKVDFSDIWVGHNRPALGLSSYFDSHGLLMPTLSMMGFGFDRDWGAGFYKESEKGSVAATLTTGSGMPFIERGNYLASLRQSKGILAVDNYNFGISIAYGKVMDTMGYELMSPDPKETLMFGMDYTNLFESFENRVDIMVGSDDKKPKGALLYRWGMNLLEENRLKIELQPVYVYANNTGDIRLDLGASFAINSSLSFRAMYENTTATGGQKIVFQLYSYYNM